MNPTALITGASRGIGRGIALELAKLGHDLVINYAGNAEAARQTAADCVEAARQSSHRIRALPCQGDISLASDRVRLVEFTRNAFGQLNLLVNNAGVAPSVRADLLEASEESFDRLLAINVKGPYFLTQLVARWMIEQVTREGGMARSGGGEVRSSKFEARSPQSEVRGSKSEAQGSELEGGGARSASHDLRTEGEGSGAGRQVFAIVTVTSISAYTASVNRGDYCVSKAALSMLTPLYAERLAEYGIRVYEIRPGIIATDMTGPVREKYEKLIGEGLTPIRRWGQPEDVGRAVAAIALNALPFSTGEVLNVDGGFHLRRL